MADTSRKSRTPEEIAARAEELGGPPMTHLPQFNAGGLRKSMPMKMTMPMKVMKVPIAMKVKKPLHMKRPT